MDIPEKPVTGFEQLLRATGHSIDGLRSAYRGERAFRQEFWLAAVLVPASFWVGRHWLETAVLVSTVMLVLVVELVNSAIEAAIDRVSYERHELSKRAKDLGSAAVLVSLLLCAAVWAAALWQHVAPQ